MTGVITAHYAEPLYHSHRGDQMRIEDREILPELPEGSHGFAIYDVTEYTAVSGELLSGQPRNRSNVFFGLELTIDQVDKINPKEATWLRKSGITRVFKLNERTFIPLEDSDKVIPRGT